MRGKFKAPLSSARNLLLISKMYFHSNYINKADFRLCRISWHQSVITAHYQSRSPHITPTKFLHSLIPLLTRLVCSNNKTYVPTALIINREESKLRIFENRILMRIFGPKRDANGEWIINLKMRYVPIDITFDNFIKRI